MPGSILDGGRDGTTAGFDLRSVVPDSLRPGSCDPSCAKAGPAGRRGIWDPSTRRETLRSMRVMVIPPQQPCHRTARQRKESHIQTNASASSVLSACRSSRCPPAALVALGSLPASCSRVLAAGGHSTVISAFGSEQSDTGGVFGRRPYLEGCSRERKERGKGRSRSLRERVTMVGAAVGL